MLNPRSIEAAVKSAKIEQLLVDGTGERGSGRLALRIRPGRDEARAEWLALWYRAGKKQTGVLGRYPALSLREARDRFADEWRPEIEAGRDPRRARDVSSATGTCRQLFEEYVAFMKAQGRRSWPVVERALLTGGTAAVKSLGADTLASEVTPAMVADYLAGLYRKGSRVAADRYRAYLHAAFQWGAASTHDYTRDPGTGPATHFGIVANPVSVVPRDTGANKPRDRVLSLEEWRSLWHALDGEGFGLSTAPAIRLLLCTGQRVLDVLRAEVADFDLKAALWVIPAHKRKVGETEHVVPLPPQAVAVLRELVGIRKKGLLFPKVGGKPDEHVPDQSVNRALARWARRSKVPAFQARDLRRSWKTHAGEAGLSKEIRDRLQGHALRDVSSMHYDRYAYLREKKAAMRQWGGWLTRAVSPRAAEVRAAA